MNLILILLASFSVFAGTFRDRLLELDRCFDQQSDIVENYEKSSRARYRESDRRLKEVREKYEEQFLVTRVAGLLASTATFDTCAEDPESSNFVVGKLKGYQRRSSDLFEIDNMLSDIKFMSVKASFSAGDYLYGRTTNQKELKNELRHAAARFDSQLRQANGLAKTYGHSYPVKSCLSLANSL